VVHRIPTLLHSTGTQLLLSTYRASTLAILYFTYCTATLTVTVTLLLLYSLLFSSPLSWPALAFLVYPTLPALAYSTPLTLIYLNLL
jgi:hypothetical protein